MPQRQVDVREDVCQLGRGERAEAVAVEREGREVRVAPLHVDDEELLVERQRPPQAAALAGLVTQLKLVLPFRWVAARDQPLWHGGGTDRRQHHAAELLDVDRARLVVVKVVDHLCELRVGRRLAELAQHHPELSKVDVTSAVIIKEHEGLPELALLRRVHEVGVAVLLHLIVRLRHHKKSTTEQRDVWRTVGRSASRGSVRR